MTKIIKQHPSKEYLNDVFNYSDGNIFWKKVKLRTDMIGVSSGSLMSNEYYHTGIGKKRFYNHRLIWIYHNGDIPIETEIDHINGIRSDNRIENLTL